MNGTRHGCGWSSCGDPRTRLFAQGWRCRSHSPSALAGVPEPEEIAEVVALLDAYEALVKGAR